MNRDEPRQVVRAHLAQYRAMAYDALSKLIEVAPSTETVLAPSGVKYQVELQAFWDDEKDGVIRVRAALDDGGLRALVPLCEDFLMRPDGSFVDARQRRISRTMLWLFAAILSILGAFFFFSWFIQSAWLGSLPGHPVAVYAVWAYTQLGLAVGFLVLAVYAFIKMTRQ